MVSTVAEVVEAAFCISKESTGSGAHAVAIGALDDVGSYREGGTADRVIFGAGPETKDHEIRLLELPPEWVSSVLLKNPKDGKDGRFRISDFGMRKGIWGGTWQPYFVPQLRDFEGLLPTVFCFVRYCFGWVWLGRRMHDKVGIVAECAEGFGQKTKVAVPEKLVGANGQVGVKEDFQS